MQSLSLTNISQWCDIMNKELAQRSEGMCYVKHLRPEVEAFAVAMEKKLRLNDHKGGWHNLGIDDLVRRLMEEVNELIFAIKFQGPNEITSECCDIGNFAMMIQERVRQ